MSKTDRIIVRHDFPADWGPFLRLVLESYTKTLGPDARRLPLSEAPLVPLAFCSLLWWLGYGHLVTKERVEEAAGRAGPPGPKPKHDNPQTSLLDVVTWDHDELPGVYVSLVRLNGGTASATCGRYTLDLHGCRVPETALPRAYAAGWGVLPERRGKGSGASDGLRFLPPSIVAAWFCDNRPKLFNGSPSIAEPTPVAESAPEAAASEPQPPCHPKPCFYHQAVGAMHCDVIWCAAAVDAVIRRYEELESMPVDARTDGTSAERDTLAHWLGKRRATLRATLAQESARVGALVWSDEIDDIGRALSAAGRDPDTGFLRPRFTCDCPAEGCEGPGDARHEPEPDSSGQFCACRDSDGFCAGRHEDCVCPCHDPPIHVAPASSELPDPSPNFPPSDFFDNQPEPAEDPPPSEKPAPSPPVKRGRGRPKGSKSGARPLPAESAIRKSGKRARS